MVVFIFKHLNFVLKDRVLLLRLLLINLEFLHNLLKLIYLLIQLIFLLSHHFNFLLLVTLIQSRYFRVAMLLVVRPIKGVLRVRHLIILAPEAALV